jgi:hypothetical protein
LPSFQPHKDEVKDVSVVCVFAFEGFWVYCPGASFDRAELKGIWSGGHICLKLTSHAVCASADLGPRYMHDYVRSVDQNFPIPKVTRDLLYLGPPPPSGTRIVSVRRDVSRIGKETGRTGPQDILSWCLDRTCLALYRQSPSHRLLSVRGERDPHEYNSTRQHSSNWHKTRDPEAYLRIYDKLLSLCIGLSTLCVRIFVNSSRTCSAQ